MDIGNFQSAFQWVIQHGYLLMFLVMLIEGPVITAAAAFAAALGYFDIRIVIILAILGDVVADVFFYIVGYLGRISFVERYGHRIGITRQRIEKIEQLFSRHPGKLLVAIKLAPLLPPIGLALAGAVRTSFKRFLIIIILMTLPKVALFTVLGYYFGQSYSTLASTTQSISIIIGFAALLIVALYGYRYISGRISKRLEDI